MTFMTTMWIEMKTNLTRATLSQGPPRNAQEISKQALSAIVHGTGALFDQHMHALPSDMWYI